MNKVFTTKLWFAAALVLCSILYLLDTTNVTPPSTSQNDSSMTQDLSQKSEPLETTEQTNSVVLNQGQNQQPKMASPRKINIGLPLDVDQYAEHIDSKQNGAILIGEELDVALYADMMASKQSEPRFIGDPLSVEDYILKQSEMGRKLLGEPLDIDQYLLQKENKPKHIGPNLSVDDYLNAAADNPN